MEDKCTHCDNILCPIRGTGGTGECKFIRKDEEVKFEQHLNDSVKKLKEQRRNLEESKK